MDPTAIRTDGNEDFPVFGNVSFNPAQASQEYSDMDFLNQVNELVYAECGDVAMENGSVLPQTIFMHHVGNDAANGISSSYQNYHYSQDSRDLGNGPSIVILEQPQAQGHRFRYKAEGNTHGPMQGHSSTKDRKVFPEIQILNSGVAELFVRVRLVAPNDDNAPHPFQLQSKDCNTAGILDRHITERECPRFKIRFQNISILKVKQRDYLESLTEQLQVLYPDRNKTEIKAEAEQLAKKKYSGGVVRFRFEAFYRDPVNQSVIHLHPVFSHPIHDSKATNTAELKICRLSAISGKCTGKEEVFMFCEKINKDDIEVVFEDGGGWKAKGDFQTSDVHRQYAIAFKTPSYRDLNISEPQEVKLFLYRPSTVTRSEPVIFTYHPDTTDEDEIHLKRKVRKLNSPASISAIEPRSSSTAAQRSKSNTQLKMEPGNSHASSSACSETLLRIGACPSSTSGDYDDDLEMDCSYIQSVAKPAFTNQISNRLDSGLDLEEHQAKSSKPITQRAPSQIDDGEVKRMEQIELISTQSMQHYAISGDHRYFVSMLRNFVPFKDDHGDSCLHLAVIHKQSKALRDMLELCKANNVTGALNSFNHRQQTPLHVATILGDQDSLQELLRHGADPFLLNSNGNNCWHIAAEANDVRALSILCTWCQQQHRPVSNYDVRNFEGLSPLLVAVTKSNLQSVQYLLEAGVQADFIDSKSGRTALHHAVDLQDYNVTCCLLTMGKVTANAQTFSGVTALHIAVARCNLRIIRLLVNAGADPYLTSCGDGDDHDGDSAVTLARGNQQMLRILVPGSEHDYALDATLTSLSSQTRADFIACLNRRMGDWKRLARELKVSETEFGLQVSPLRPPTLHLVTYLERNSCTVKQLETALRRMGRSDCVNVIIGSLAAATSATSTTS